MTSSFGEQEIVWNSQIIGRLRVLDLTATAALSPRMSIAIGVTLRELRNGESAGNPTGPYYLADLVGELQIRQEGPVITDVRWIDRERKVRSLAFEDETRIELGGSLQLGQLERLEADRNGEAPVFWLKLHPLLVGSDGAMHTRAVDFPLHIPRERWSDFLEGCEFGGYEIVELPIPRVDPGRFKASAKELDVAIAHLRQGQYDRAALGCRKALDAIQRENHDDKHWRQLRVLLDSLVGEVRAAAHVEIVKLLKQLGNPAAHPASGPYRREEAQLMVRATASLLAIIGRCEPASVDVE